jgi:hypothetical protein
MKILGNQRTLTTVANSTNNSTIDNATTVSLYSNTAANVTISYSANSTSYTWGINVGERQTVSKGPQDTLIASAANTVAVIPIAAGV